MLENVVVIIPALNEEETVADVICGLQQQGLYNICVVDNGSCDRTLLIAAKQGATVVKEPRQGYGQACWTGLQTPAAQAAEWILFCDGDGSDDLSQLPELLRMREKYDFVLGNRRGTLAGRQLLTYAQNFGNWLATRLIRFGWGYAYEDLGPLRLIRKESLDGFAMRDRGFGWTVEMQTKAAAQAVERGLRICERPVNYLPRQGGRSKIAGTIRGSGKAGQVILTTLARLYLQKIGQMTGAIALWEKAISVSQQTLFQRGLLCVVSFLFLTGSILAAPHGDFLNDPQAVPLFWRGMSLMGVGFVGAWCLRKVGGLWFWGIAIAPRLILLSMYPGDDIWRYIWEGHIQILGFNPYLLAPDVAVLAPFRFDWWSQINHPDLAAIYPPITQLCFRLLAAISPSVLLFKSAFVAADLCICGLLSRRFGYRATLLYAWNPLVMYSFAGGGHYDSWFLLPLVVAWLGWESPHPKSLSLRERDFESGSLTLRERARVRDAKILTDRKSLSALALGASIGIKWMSLPLLGLFAWRSRWRWWIVVLLLGSLPMAIASFPFCQLHPLSCPVVPLSSPFVIYGRSAALIPQFVAMMWPASVKANWIYALPLMGVILWNFRRSVSISQFMGRYFVTLMLLSPIIHAWYFTWLMPFAVASQSWGARLVSLSVFVYFALPYGLAVGIEDWRLNALQYGLLWVPFVIGLLVSVGRGAPQRE